MAEDYVLVADGDHTIIRWTMAAEPTALGRLTAPGTKLLLRELLRRAAHRLSAHLAADAA
jgi:hypothetical protein